MTVACRSATQRTECFPSSEVELVVKIMFITCYCSINLFFILIQQPQVVCSLECSTHSTQNYLYDTAWYNIHTNRFILNFGRLTRSRRLETNITF